MVKASHQAFAALNKTTRQHTIGDIQHDAMLAARDVERHRALFVASSLQRMQNWNASSPRLRAAKAAAKMAAKLRRAAARSPVGAAAVATT